MYLKQGIYTPDLHMYEIYDEPVILLQNMEILAIIEYIIVILHQIILWADIHLIYLLLTHEVQDDVHNHEIKIFDNTIDSFETQ